MKDELATQDINLGKDEFANPDKSRQANVDILGPKKAPDKTTRIPSLRDATQSVPRVDPVVLRGSTPSSHEEGYDKTNGLKRTKADKTGHLFENELSPKQETAIEMMLGGRTDLEISHRLKMRRQTINEWRNHNMDFIYELQMRRNQLWEKHRDKMSRAVDKAFDILSPSLQDVEPWCFGDLRPRLMPRTPKNLDNKDEKIQLDVAMQLVRMTGVQENLKNKTPMDRNTMEANKFDAALKQALEEVTKELGLA